MVKLAIGSQQINGIVPKVTVGSTHQVHHFYLGIALVLIGACLIWHDYKYHAGKGNTYEMFKHLIT